MDIAIRQAAAADEPAIHACAEQAYARYVYLIGRPPAPMTADFAQQIAAGAIHVATGPNDRVVGFVVFWARYGHVLLENVAVEPAMGGRGLGRALIAFCETAARASGLGLVRLYTNAAMTDNLAIYPRLGYRQVGRRTEDGFDRVHFEKRLS